MSAQATTRDHVTLELEREELFLLLLALTNAQVDLGRHEEKLCTKVRDAWDATNRALRGRRVIPAA